MRRARCFLVNDALAVLLTSALETSRSSAGDIEQIDVLTAQIGRLTARVEELLAAIAAAQGVDADGTTGPGAGSGTDAVVLPAVVRLDEVTGIGPGAAQVVFAEIGLDSPGFISSAPRPCRSPSARTAS